MKSSGSSSESSSVMVKGTHAGSVEPGGKEMVPDWGNWKSTPVREGGRGEGGRGERGREGGRGEGGGREGEGRGGKWLCL